MMNPPFEKKCRDVEIQIHALIEKAHSTTKCWVKKSMVLTPTSIFQDIGHFVVKEILEPNRCPDGFSLTYDGLVIFNHPNIRKFLKKRECRVVHVIFHQGDMDLGHRSLDDANNFDSLFTLDPLF